MATSSIFNRVILSTEEEVEKLANALEKAEKAAEELDMSPVRARDMGPEDIRRAFGKNHG